MLFLGQEPVGHRGAETWALALGECLFVLVLFKFKLSSLYWKYLDQRSFRFQSFWAFGIFA